MTRLSLSAVLLGSSLALTPAAHADTDLGKIIGGVAQGLLNQEVDKAAFAEAQRANTARAYRNYLDRFPKGLYRGNAQQALTRLEGKATSASPKPTARSSAAQTEDAIGLTRAQRVRIQQQLTRIGYDTGVADGLWGRSTRGAIGRWQRAQGFEGTGYLTQQQVARIADQAQNKGETRADTASHDDDAVEERLLSLSAAERREIQLRLTLLGYDTKGTDGVFGANTRRAIARWQDDQGMRDSGFITADQIRVLTSQSRG